MKGNLSRLFVRQASNLGAAGVRKGSGFVTSTVLLRDDRLGKVTDITPDRQNPELFWIAGLKNIMAIQPDGRVTSVIPVPVGTFDFHWVDLDNKAALINAGSWVSAPFLLDANGKTVWSYSSESTGVNNMTACYNILGDNKTEFVVGFNGAGGVHLLDENGHLVWKVPEVNVWHVEAQDLNDDGKVKIVHSDSKGKLVVRNPDGMVLKEYQPPVYVSNFTLTDWINPDGPTAALLPDQTKYVFYSFTKGAIVAEWESGIDISQGKTRANWVVWNPASGKSLAILTTFILNKQSVLTIYSEAGQMQYQEVFPEACEGLGVVDGTTPGSHFLLCGGDGQVIQYQKPQ